jgi:hypothetical protein
MNNITTNTDTTTITNTATTDTTTITTNTITTSTTTTTTSNNNNSIRIYLRANLTAQMLITELARVKTKKQQYTTNRMKPRAFI